MPEIYLRWPWFTFSACGPFTKNKERIQKFKETGDSRYIHQNELDKACFDDMTYRDFENLTKRTASDKILHDEGFNNAINPKYDGYEEILLQWFFDKKTSGGTVKNENISDLQLEGKYASQLLENSKKEKWTQLL